MKPMTLKHKALKAYLDPASPTYGQLTQTADLLDGVSYYNVRDWYKSYQKGSLDFDDLKQYPDIKLRKGRPKLKVLETKAPKAKPVKAKVPTTKSKVDGRTVAGREAKYKKVAAEAVVVANIPVDDLVVQNDRLMADITSLKKALKRSRHKNMELARLVRSMAGHIGTRLF